MNLIPDLILIVIGSWSIYQGVTKPEAEFSARGAFLLPTGVIALLIGIGMIIKNIIIYIFF